MKIVIFTSFQPHNIYVVNRITHNFQVLCRVIEDPSLRVMTRKENWARWRKINERYGIIKTLNRYLYLRYYRKFRKAQDEADKIDILFPGKQSIQYESDIPTIKAPSINDDSVYDYVKSIKPDIICVCGTSVIKPHIFSLAKIGAINIHVGITPEYRCAKPIEWALFNKDFENVGVTVHFIDEDVDTGEIIYQETIPVERGDSIGKIYAKCKIRGAEMMLSALEQIRKEGRIDSWRKQGVPGRKYISHEFGLTHYLNMMYNLRHQR